MMSRNGGSIRYFYNPDYLHPGDYLYRAVVEAVLKQTHITDNLLNRMNSLVSEGMLNPCLNIGQFYPFF
jgi:hypothetical protein